MVFTRFPLKNLHYLLFLYCFESKTNISTILVENLNPRCIKQFCDLMSRKHELRKIDSISELCTKLTQSQLTLYICVHQNRNFQAMFFICENISFDRFTQEIWKKIFWMIWHTYRYERQNAEQFITSLAVSHWKPSFSHATLCLWKLLVLALQKIAFWIPSKKYFRYAFP